MDLRSSGRPRVEKSVSATKGQVLQIRKRGRRRVRTMSRPRPRLREERPRRLREPQGPRTFQFPMSIKCHSLTEVSSVINVEPCDFQPSTSF